jgi:hypothetical protein
MTSKGDIHTVKMILDTFERENYSKEVLMSHLPVNMKIQVMQSKTRKVKSKFKEKWPTMYQD